ncbi:MAG: hypothetical protein HXX16_15740 [Bacteroidales bacterium]|nr:hypothetical protein [Bacteroidales bacterium]
MSSQISTFHGITTSPQIISDKVQVDQGRPSAPGNTIESSMVEYIGCSSMFTMGLEPTGEILLQSPIFIFLRNSTIRDSTLADAQ